MPEKRPPMRFTDEELTFIKSTFKGNDTLLKLLRKVFLPEYDPYAPVGQTVDLWSALNVHELDPQTAWLKMAAREQVIKHVEAMLMQVKILSEIEEETPEQRAERQRKDSAK